MGSVVNELRARYNLSVNDFVTKIFLAIPWFFIIWLISQSFDGAIDGFLTFVLVVILVPVAIIMNLVTVLFSKGTVVMKQMKDMQNMGQKKQTVAAESSRQEAVNYAELPWYDVRRWMNK